MSHLSKISISIFLHHFLKTSKCFIVIQTPLQLDIWLQSYEGFDNVKNIMKQRNMNNVFANISKTTSPTSDSFHLIMSHIVNFPLPTNQLNKIQVLPITVKNKDGHFWMHNLAPL